VHGTAFKILIISHASPDKTPLDEQTTTSTIDNFVRQEKQFLTFSLSISNEHAGFAFLKK